MSTSPVQNQSSFFPPITLESQMQTFQKAEVSQIEESLKTILQKETWEPKEFEDIKFLFNKLLKEQPLPEGLRKTINILFMRFYGTEIHLLLKHPETDFAKVEELTKNILDPSLNLRNRVIAEIQEMCINNIRCYQDCYQKICKAILKKDDVCNFFQLLEPQNLLTWKNMTSPFRLNLLFRTHQQLKESPSDFQSSQLLNSILGTINEELTAFGLLYIEETSKNDQIKINKIHINIMKTLTTSLPATQGKSKTELLKKIAEMEEQNSKKEEEMNPRKSENSWRVWHDIIPQRIKELLFDKEVWYAADLTSALLLCSRTYNEFPSLLNHWSDEVENLLKTLNRTIVLTNLDLIQLLEEILSKRNWEKEDFEHIAELFEILPSEEFLNNLLEKNYESYPDFLLKLSKLVIDELHKQVKNLNDRICNQLNLLEKKRSWIAKDIRQIAPLFESPPEKILSKRPLETIEALRTQFNKESEENAEI